MNILSIHTRPGGKRRMRNPLGCGDRSKLDMAEWTVQEKLVEGRLSLCSCGSYVQDWLSCCHLPSAAAWVINSLQNRGGNRKKFMNTDFRR